MSAFAGIENIFERAAQHQVEMWFEGDRLRYRAPGGALPDDLRADLSQRKAEILEALRQRAAQEESVFPLSYGQQALWFLNQSDPSSAAYHVAFAGRVTSDINLAALRNALQALLDRHSVLRARVVAEDGAPALRIPGYQPVDLECVDAAGWDEAQLYAAVRAAYLRPMDLETGPLLRAHLFSQGARDHVILLTMNHIAVDGWSVWILLDELRALYAAAVTGKPANLPRPPSTYQDYVEWQRTAVDGEQGEALWQFWRDMLSGDLPTLALPTDHPRPPVQTTNGDTVDFVLPAGLTQQLKALAKAEGATLYHLLFAAYQVLLQRYTGQADIITGLPTFGREKAEFARVVGDFINMLALRVSVEGDPSFRDFLAQVRRQVLDGLQHQDYPFPLLVARLGIPRDPSRSPLFQVTFDVQRGQSGTELSSLFGPADGAAEVDFGGLQMLPYPMPQQEGQFDLSLLMLDAETTLPGTLKYNSDLFKRETVEQIARHYANLLHAIAADPSRPLSALSLLSEDERHKILVEWNQTDLPYPRDTFLHQLFEAQAARAPNATALIFGDKTLSYAELNERANQLAHYLRRHGAQPNQLVGICMERSLEMIVAIFGVLKSGAAYVPVDPAYPPDRIAWTIEDSGMNLLLLHEPTRDRLPETSIQLAAVDADWSRIAREDRANPPAVGSTESLAYVIYTSGSTGKPKGSMIPHRAIVSQITWMQHAFPTSPEDVVMQKASFSFDASVCEAHVPLANGGTLLLADPGGEQDGMYMVDAIQQHRVTKMLMVPSVLQLLVETPGFEKCTSLRYLFVGGEALSMALVRDLRAVNPVQLVNLYGPTETTIDTIYWVCDPDYPGEMAILGRPVGNTRAYALDAHLQPVPVGVTGELHTGGAQVGKGYLGRPELTAERFINDPFDPHPDARLYKTGDLVRYRPDGLLEYLGRNDSQVKIRGFRIELGEIEAVLSQHPGVQGAVVTVREDSGGEKRLAAYIVPREGPAPSVRDLRAYLKDRLPAYMIPSYFVTLDEFPITASGKVDRRALPAPERSGAEAQRVLQPPVTDTEQKLAQIWKDLLKVEQVNLFDNFFDLGGHSLLAMRLVARAQQAFGRRLDPALLRFETLGQIAARLDAPQSQAV